MAIVDVEIPSGYECVEYKDPGVIERHEIRGDNAVFYINEVRRITNCFYFYNKCSPCTFVAPPVIMCSLKMLRS